MPEGIRDTVFSLNDKRAMNQGFGDGMSRAFELVATPLVFGGLGYLVDLVAGTAPVFMIVLAVFGVIGTFVRFWYGYDAEMRRHESSGAWVRRDERVARSEEPLAEQPDIWSTRREIAS